MQFLATNDKETAEILGGLHGPVFELVEFTAAALLAYLETLPRKATIIWEEGKVRPRVPGAEPVDKPFRGVLT